MSKNENAKEVKPDKFHYHEFLDRTHLIQDMVQDHLADHLVATFPENAEYRKRIEKIQKHLWKLYRMTGQNKSS